MFLPSLFLLILVSCIFLIPDVYAHPVALKAGIGGDGEYFVKDLINKNVKESDEPFFLSLEWMQKYPVGVLGIGIAVFMINYIVILFREGIHNESQEKN